MRRPGPARHQHNAGNHTFDIIFVVADWRYLLAGTTPATGAPYATGRLVPWGIQAVQADLLAGSNVSGTSDGGTGNWFTDENHHGTHVAGTISALNAAGTGVVGVSENGTLKLHIIQVFNAAGWAYSSTLANAAEQCRLAGANIISMSLGGPTSNRTEDTKFKQLLSNHNILSIAAAGNDGNTRTSYPSGYASVVSVAAVAGGGTLSTFSQRNKDVEIAGPGVNVLSTVPMGSGQASALTVGGTSFAPGGMEGSPNLAASGALADVGIGDTLGAMTGKVCLIQRGSVDFAVRVSNCQASGGVGAVIDNNVAGGFGGALGTTLTSIQSVTVSDTEGTALKARIGQWATVVVTPSNHAFFEGTSMATPHVSAVAAIVWARNPNCTASQLRTSLNLRAKDPGTTGRDASFGHGMVQAQAADERIKLRTCGL